MQTTCVLKFSWEKVKSHSYEILNFIVANVRTTSVCFWNWCGFVFTYKHTLPVSGYKADLHRLWLNCNGIVGGWRHRSPHNTGLIRGPWPVQGFKTFLFFGKRNDKIIIFLFTKKKCFILLRIYKKYIFITYFNHIWFLCCYSVNLKRSHSVICFFVFKSTQP